LKTLAARLAALGYSPAAIEPLAGDASMRCFFRLRRDAGEPAVATLYPEGHEAQAAHDFGVQRWAWGHGLPIPRPLAADELVVVSSDVGDVSLEQGLRRQGTGLLAATIAALGRFQACPWREATNPPFDAPFFRRELTVFEEYALGASTTGRGDVGAFLDDLSERLARHPYRLVHRDFHVNNLFLCDGTVWAVDYQDLRGGPDSYDLASLLRERAGAELTTSEHDWQQRAAAALGWEKGWERRYQECAAQRGLKVIGTFCRLASLGRRSYLAWLPAVRAKAMEALIELCAPPALLRALSPSSGPGL
jgi:aminoglycoside/choline kinase family phosphotransferase